MLTGESSTGEGSRTCMAGVVVEERREGSAIFGRRGSRGWSLELEMLKCTLARSQGYLSQECFRIVCVARTHVGKLE